jgi:hypothetical protein
MKATAITLPLIVMSWFLGISCPCAAISASRGRITSSFSSATMEDVAMTAEVYSAGLPCIPGRLIFWWFAVRFDFTVSAPTWHFAALAATVRMAGNSLPTIFTRPLVTPHWAFAAKTEASKAAAEVAILTLKPIAILPFFFVRTDPAHGGNHVRECRLACFACVCKKELECVAEVGTLRVPALRTSEKSG